MQGYRRRNEAVTAAANDYDTAADGGDYPPIYNIGSGVLDGEDISISPTEIQIPGFANSANLDLKNPWNDMT